jgi:hypothetical protein
MDTKGMDIIGTWHLARCVELSASGEVLREPFGPAPLGQIMYAEDGGMAAVLAHPDRSSTLSARPGPISDEDAQVLAHDYAGYAGNWEVGDGILKHHVRVSFIPGWVGGVQIRNAHLDGDVLTLSVIADPDAATSAKTELTWHRAVPRKH